MSLTRAQVDALLQPLHPSRVRQVQGNAHLEAWDVRRHLLRVFGWGGWDFEVIACDLVSERSKWDEQNPLKGRHTVVYRVLGRLVIKSPDGTVLAQFEDGATGDAANQPSLGDAHDMAMKTAMSQALKRCAMNLGDLFGLGLYNDGKTDAVVGRSLAHEHEPVPATDHVEGGEMEQPAETDRGWFTDWQARVADSTDLSVLRGLYAEADGQVKVGKLADDDATTALQLVEARAAEISATQQAGAA